MGKALQEHNEDLLSLHAPEPVYRKATSTKGLVLYLTLLAIWYLYCLGLPFSDIDSSLLPSVYAKFPSIQAPLHPCTSIVPPILHLEYTARQTKVANILHEHQAAAYFAEPGAQTQFLGNFSSVNWKLSERPLLLIITAQKDKDSGTIKSKVSLLTPKFEATRARMLPIPNVSEYIEWAEDEDPYKIVTRALNLQDSKSTKVYIDNSARHFHYDGFQLALHGADIKFASAPKEISQLRERKSPAEINILKCVNEATLLAMRHVHKQMYIGISESQARNMMTTAFTQAGLSSGGCLTLFGDNAALPHGAGSDRTLSLQDFALFDCGATFNGYWSDITRTVALPNSQIPEAHLELWHAVYRAQLSAILAVQSNVTTGSIDHVARSSLRESGGLDRFFTHRLGHGIGLEGHESPYLVGGSEDLIQPGHTFSNEPGVYIEGDVGVRLEDCFFVDNEGGPVYLTAGVGGPSQSPFDP